MTGREQVTPLQDAVALHAEAERPDRRQWLVRNRVKTSRPAKHDTYECGEEPFGPAWRPTSVGFYLIALVFILFDAEAAFLFPWIQALRFAGPPAFWGMVIFLAVLFLGWIYAWRKGDLNWSR